MSAVIAALVSAGVSLLVSVMGLYLNRRWQVRQEVRAEGLKHFRALKTYGYLTLADDDRWLKEVDEFAKVREALDEVGQAIFELDLIASPEVLTAMVGMLREAKALTEQLEILVGQGKKISSDELERLRSKVRDTLVELFLAMREDAGRSNRGLKREDVLYLLKVRM